MRRVESKVRIVWGACVTAARVQGLEVLGWNRHGCARSSYLLMLSWLGYGPFFIAI